MLCKIDRDISVSVSVDPDSRFILAAEDLSVQVTVLDDGQPLLEDKNITITLIRIVGGFLTDIIVSEAIIALRALPPSPGLCAFKVFSPPLSDISDWDSTVCFIAMYTHVVKSNGKIPGKKKRTKECLHQDKNSFKLHPYIFVLLH